jgi:metallo-beta-lactamase family protein
MVKIRFYGAAEQVTGSCYLVTTDKESVLIDCGMFQGGHDTFMKNYDPFGFEPEKAGHMILTHAHADHSGRIPLLVKRGYRGKIHAHSATAELAELILMDSAHIHEVEAGWRTRKNMRKGGKRTDPLYTTADARKSLGHFARTRYHTPVRLSDSISFTLHDAGHILGSCIVELVIGGSNGGPETRIVFSGDLGRIGQPIIKDPETLSRADYLVIESTYGARKHKPMADTKEELAAIIREAARHEANIVIPAFAVGRTQEILFYIRELMEERRIPDTYNKIYVDSPMATSATAIYERALRECYGGEALRFLDHHLSPLRFEGLSFVSSVDESMMINMTPGGQIIISASGMCDAGRVLHHLRHNLWNPNSHIVFVGYQAEGTKGRKIVDGASTVKIMREEIAVRAKIHTLNALSAHADSDGLCAWASLFSPAPRLTMIVHGEKEQAAGLKKRLFETHGLKCAIPTPGEEIALVY